MRIALAGNPNSGKTTMFNALTGRNEKVGNWAGVTVEKKVHAIKKNYYSGDEALLAVDLPGAYSMSPFTSEESVTSAYIREESPDVIINIVDATNLSRSLFFTTQLLELGIPMVVALNKSDINKKKSTVIDSAALAEKLGCPVIDTVSTSSDGLSEVVRASVARVGCEQRAPYVQENAELKDKAAAMEADKARFAFVNEIVKAVEQRRVLTRHKNSQDKIDELLTNRWLGIPIFAAVMFAVFWISQAGPGVWIADLLVGWLEAGQEALRALFEQANPLLTALLIDGVVGGVIAVIGFLPLVMVMYFLIALLEDCGYMARATVVLDPIFKRVGLSGKSVIPFVIGTGCAIPGVMACRTVRDERERRATAMLAPFMPCGAKLPVIALFAGAFFGDASWVGPLMYFVGILIIFLGALLVNRVTGCRGRKSFFIIELPEYKLPSLWRAVKSMCSRGWSYVVKAATVILLCNTAVQIMQSFTWKLQAAESADSSILASIAAPIAYLLVPVIGVLSWQMAAAAVTGFIAKENVVGTLAVCFVGLENLIDTEELALLEGAGTEVAAVFAISKVAALAYLMFNLYTPPCFAAIGAMNAEMKSAKWLWAGIGLQFFMGYTIGYLVYQIGTLITEGKLGAGFWPGLIAVVLMVIAIVLITVLSDRKRKEEHALANKAQKQIAVGR
ncbi:MAG: ferrous iron transporter B [Clostridia bacterium]|nr:ferrous iron transporter B [Clostridia bacterium]